MSTTSVKPFPDVQDSHWTRHLRQPPRCFAYRTNDQSIPTGGQTAITFDATRWNFGGPTTKKLWVSTAPTVITIPPGGAGLYEVGGMFSFDVAAAGARRALTLFVNGTTLIEVEIPPIAGSIPQLNASILAELNAGDALAMTAYHDSGANLVVFGNALHRASLWCCWRCPKVGAG